MGWDITKFFDTDDVDEINRMSKESVVGQLCDMANFTYKGVPIEDLWCYGKLSNYFGITEEDYEKDFDVLREEEKENLGVDFLYKPVGHEWDIDR